MIRRVTAPQPRFPANLDAPPGDWRETRAIGRELANPSGRQDDWCETVVGDAAIAALAAHQCGVVTVAQLEIAGLGENAVRHRVKAGRLTRIFRGVYQVGPIPAPRGREMAAVLATGGVLSHDSAASVWGFRPPHAGDVHVTTTNSGRSRPGIRIHRSASLQEAVRHGLPLTTAARTLRDLRPLLPTSEYGRALEQAQVLGLVPKRPGDEPRFTRSEGERRLLALVRKARLPVPLTNTKVAGWEVDAFWPRHKLIVEVDGFGYHGHRAAFERDRRKDASLTAAGYSVIRITWWQLVHEAYEVVAKLAQLLPPLEV
jgi:very-short-patch-repair endonuclease